jgi:hypothetical protein
MKADHKLLPYGKGVEEYMATKNADPIRKLID